MVFFEWVSKNGVFFFFPTLFFFSRPLKSSEWVTGKLFLGKKKKTTFDRKKKKKQRKKWNSTKGAVFYRFWPFFGVFRLSTEWVACKLFLGKKKNSLFFFFPKHGKKKTKIAQSEWVSTPQSFPGKKKKRYLWLN